MNTYKVFWLTPGVMPPIGSTGIMVNNAGGIMWVGETRTFPSETLTGQLTEFDSIPAETYAYRAATEAEIQLYNELTTISG